MSFIFYVIQLFHITCLYLCFLSYVTFRPFPGSCSELDNQSTLKIRPTASDYDTVPRATDTTQRRHYIPLRDADSDHATTLPRHMPPPPPHHQQQQHMPPPPPSLTQADYGTVGGNVGGGGGGGSKALSGAQIAHILADKNRGKKQEKTSTYTSHVINA